ncbi:MAG: cytochrome P450 [Gammaproteobacteria bacterium]
MSVLPAQALFAAQNLEDPSRLWALLRELGPVSRIEGTRAFWVVSPDAIEDVLARHADFSANLTGVLLRQADGQVGTFPIEGAGGNAIATADEPEHAVQRRLLMPPLKASRVLGLESEIRDFAREKVAALLRAGGGDWCNAVAEVVPAFVVARLLGLGDETLDTVRRWAMMGGDMLGGLIDLPGMHRLSTENAAMHAFLSGHLQAMLSRAADQRGDSLTATLAGGVESGAIAFGQGVGILVVLFGAAGESTAALMGMALRLMLRTPGMQEQLRREPGALEAFVEETIRLESPFKFHYRVVRCDTTLAGTALAAGDRLLLGWAAANRDPARFEDPDAVRLDRPNPQRHLGFGHGIHFCIGAPLARMEVRVVLGELLAQTQWIEEPPEGSHVLPNIFVRRMERLGIRCR